jgi:hypothetical protein
VNDVIWYLIGRKKERRIHERALAVERYTMEQGVRAQYGMPPRSAQAHPRFVPAGRPLITARGVRRLALVLVTLVVLLTLLFVAFCIGYGIQHHLIYMAPSR